MYPCTGDADCPSGWVCHPPGVGVVGYAYPTCRDAGCVTGDDCESGECGLTSVYDCSAKYEFDCRVLTIDECRSDADCPASEECVFTGSDDGFACDSSHPSNCGDGRPLLIDGKPRVAETISRADWSAKLANLRPLPPAERRRRAKEWARTAAAEHASIASFARFTLQLLAIGAPADLVAGAQAAALDEVQHTRLAFDLASAYAAFPVGPGLFALTDAMPSLTPGDILHSLIDEACVTETLGIAKLYEQAESESDPVVAGILRRLARDETRHAALAWRALRWILGEYPELLPEARAQLSTLLARAQYRQNPAVDEVIRPIVAAVLAG